MILCIIFYAYLERIKSAKLVIRNIICIIVQLQFDKKQCLYLGSEKAPCYPSSGGDEEEQGAINFFLYKFMYHIVAFKI